MALGLRQPGLRHSGLRVNGPLIQSVHNLVNRLDDGDASAFAKPDARTFFDGRDKRDLRCVDYRGDSIRACKFDEHLAALPFNRKWRSFSLLR